jgi:predicted nuclease of restriction endonuclease-like (RecB) superfamily
MAVKNDYARQFYEAEALRNGWTIEQLKRQIASQFYERTALSTDKAAMLRPWTFRRLKWGPNNPTHATHENRG